MNQSLTLLLKVYLLLSLGCSSKSNFSGGSGNTQQSPSDEATSTKNPATPQPQPSEQTDLTTSESFIVGREVPNVDILWMVDNSGSMIPHIEKVRSNFTSFLTRIEQIENVNFILYSATETGPNAPLFFNKLGLNLPFQFSNRERFKHIERRVGSYDILYLAAETMCSRPGAPKESTSAKPTNLCETVYDPQLYEDMNNIVDSDLPENPLPIRGEALKLFRKDSIKVLVVVSDENSYGVNHKVFSKFLDSEGLSVKFFAFTGLDKFPNTPPNCRIHYPGIAYIELAKKHSGKAFDLCVSDWSANFDTLVQEANSISQTSFILKNHSKEINYVEINGVKVLHSKSSAVLTLKTIPNHGDTVKVVYK